MENKIRYILKDGKGAIIGYLLINFIPDNDLKICRLYQQDRTITPIFDSFNLSVEDNSIAKNMLEQRGFEEKFIMETEAV